MKHATSLTLAICCFIFLSGWGHTSRQYLASHEQLVDAVMEAIAVEAYVKSGDIAQSDESDKKGRVTLLKAAYNTYSKIEVRIDSRDCSTPRLRVKITTDEILFTRHKEWQQRIHERVLMRLRNRQHGMESKPSSLPKPVGVVVPPPSTLPAPATTPPTNPLPLKNP